MEPTTIQDQPVPLLDGTQTTATGSASTGDSTSVVIVPTTQVDQKFPQAIVSKETISQSLDTETKRIKGSYAFESLGAIKIGEFNQGVSGEVDISPNGITAKNVNGDTTFALDGTTGDATFRGIVQAAGFDIIDDTGLVSLSAFISGSYENDSSISTSSLSEVDVSGSDLTFVLTRSTKVLISYFAVVNYSGSTNGTSYGAGVGVNIDGIHLTYPPRSLFMLVVTGATFGFSKYETVGQSKIFTLAAGSHTIKLEWFTLAGGQTVGMDQRSLSYLLLGS